MTELNDRLMEVGYIKISRKILEWQWYSNQNVKNLFIHCLLKANFKEKKWQNITIKRGEFVTSLKNLSSELGLSTGQIRNAIRKLQTTNEIKAKSTNKYTVIQVINYNDYQTNNKPTANQLQTNCKPTATTKKDNKENKENIFNLFWEKYPNKVAKQKVKSKFLKLPQNDIDKILSTIDYYLSNPPFEGYNYPNPLTYLNQKRYNDVIVKTTNKFDKFKRLHNTPVGTITSQINNKLKHNFLFSFIDGDSTIDEVKKYINYRLENNQYNKFEQ